MTATNHSTQLKGIVTATASQMAKFIEVKAEKEGRILRAEMMGGYLNIFYRTMGGYFVHAIFNQGGNVYEKNYFYNWNEIDGEPFNPLTFK